jgi:hypothetical protein
MVAEMSLLESLYPMFLDGRPTVHHSSRCNKNRVVGEERRQGSGIAVIECFVKLLGERVNLFDCLRIDRVFLLGKCGTAKLIASPTRVISKCILIFSSGGLERTVATDPLRDFLRGCRLHSHYSSL